MGFLWIELLEAWLLSIPITEMNRVIERQLEKRVHWKENPSKRFLSHFLLLSICLIIILNIIGNAYLWVTKKGFFSGKQMAVINAVTFVLAIFLTFITWAISFYKNWLIADRNAQQATKLAYELQQKIVQAEQFIEAQKGNARIRIQAQIIRLAKIESGIVRIYTAEGDNGIFNGSLAQLSNLLPNYLFFQVSRDALLHKDVIQKVTSSSFGKIELTITTGYGGDSSFTVSRPKAAAFRKWYHSNSE
ncbi:MAG: LytTR family transcriptional regulator DNA-binding domain-containing protein [Flammeovirgaceae bacterium]